MSRLAVVFIMEDMEDDKTPRDILHDIYFDKPEKMFEESSCYFAFKFKSLKQKVRMIPQRDVVFEFEDTKEDYTNMKLVKGADSIKVEEIKEDEESIPDAL